MEMPHGINDEPYPLTEILNMARSQNRPARQSEWIHVSDLLNKCIRKIALREQQHLPPAQQVLTLMDTLTFSVGDTIHDVVKERTVAGSPSEVWGNWQCECKTMTTESPCLFSEVDHSATCTACGGPYAKYVEVPMRDDELRIVGTPDLILYLQRLSALYVTELKSISHDQWKEMVRPLPDHVLQVLFYWFLMRRLGYRLVGRVSIMYVTKGYVFGGSPVKEFTFDPREIIGRLDPYLEEAAALRKFRADGTLPVRIMCANDRSPDAKKCDMCSSCFGNQQNAAPRKISAAAALGKR